MARIGSMNISNKFLITIAAAFVGLMVLAVVVANLGSGEPTDETPTIGLAEALESPEDYTGYQVSFTARVTEAEGSSGDQGMFMETIDESASSVYVYTSSDEEFNFEDYAEVTGTIDGHKEGENKFGTEMSELVVQAKSIRKLSRDEAVAPATLTKEPGTIQQVGDVSVKLAKIEYAEQETRFYLQIENNSSSTYTYSSYDSTLVQSKKDITTADYEGNNEETDGDIAPGSKIESKLYFAKINPDRPATLTVELSNINSYEPTKVEFVL